MNDTTAPTPGTTITFVAGSAILRLAVTAVDRRTVTGWRLAADGTPRGFEPSRYPRPAAYAVD